MQKIVILKMEEFNPRRDRKKHSWMRINNTIQFDLKKLNPAQKWFWVALLGLASFKQRDWIPLDYDDLKDDTKVEQNDMENAIKFFEKEKMIRLMNDQEYAEYVSGNQLVTARLPSGVPTDRQTEQTDRRNKQTEEGPILVDEPENCASSALLFGKLAKNEGLRDVLLNIRSETLGSFMKYDLDWLENSLLHAISSLMKKQNVTKASSLNDLDTALIKWFKNEKKPKFSQFHANALDFKDHSITGNAEMSGASHES